MEAFKEGLSQLSGDRNIKFRVDTVTGVDSPQGMRQVFADLNKMLQTGD